MDLPILIIRRSPFLIWRVSGQSCFPWNCIQLAVERNVSIKRQPKSMAWLSLLLKNKLLKRLIMKNESQKFHQLVSTCSSVVQQLICTWHVAITVIFWNIGTDRSEQTVQTQIRLLLLEEQSDQCLLCLLFCLHLLNAILHCKIQLFHL